ncbi:hypothetical protein [Kineococcus rhizosphaerae]|uniref:Uncharacterized protein n=1 Tax=Kineococcus rhizosphaerae TaxID=559628 RepID=A0A2T0R8B4_9ACTN|nr:hypothetical protein [Kineococcus rhizosphaerae]PRY17411.1 hypothetical protein CLV37_102374 [Kineococcus rhizosphaerae]
MPGAEVLGGPARRALLGIDLEVLHRVLPFRPGVPRAEVGVPVSPTGRVDDTVLFEDPLDPAAVSYLPRYRLRVLAETGRYDIATTLVDGLWRTVFGLESYPAPEVDRPGAAILPHELSVTVSTRGELAREYPVAELDPGLGPTRNTPQVVLLLTLPERDALLRAFTRDEDQALLVVHRSVSVAVPAHRLPPRPDLAVALGPDVLATHVILPDLLVDPDPGPHPEPVQELVEHVERVPVDRPRPEETGTAVVTAGLARAAGLHVDFRQQLTVDRGFAGALRPVDVGAGALLRRFQSPEVAEVGEVAEVADLARLERFRDVVRDHRGLPGRGPVRGWPRPFPKPFPWPFPAPVPDPDPDPGFVVTSSRQDCGIALRFDVATHPYLFPSGQPPTTKGFATFVVPWPPEGPASRGHVYLQDQDCGNVFLHLPDVFLVGRAGEAPYGPELSFTVGRASAPDGTEQALALVSAHLVPQTSAARLADARRALAAHVPAGGAPVELRPAIQPATCRLDLPGGPVTTAAAPDLVAGWWIAESFSFEALREVYAVLGSGAGNPLRGRVDVTAGDATHQVPVELRLDRPAVPPLSWTETPREDGSWTVTLTNVGTDPLSVPGPPAWVVTDAGPVPATVTGPTPATIAPAATLDLVVTGPPGASDVQLDVTGVRVVVTPEAVVAQTLDRRVERLPRRVKLLTTAAGLGRTGDPAQDLSAIGVEFEGVAGAVLLDADTLQLDVAVPVPLRDWLLDRGEGTYSFRQTLVHVAGTSTADTAWRSSDSSLLTFPQA